MFFNQAACLQPQTTDVYRNHSPRKFLPTEAENLNAVRQLVESTLKPSLPFFPPLATPDPLLVRHRLWATARLVLNVGGARHEVLWATIEGRATSWGGGRLGRLRKCRSHEDLMALCDDFDLDSMEFYFDRHPVCFAVVLNYYRTGKLHLVDDLCVMALAQELRYWEVDELCLETCCQATYFARKDKLSDEMRKDEENDKKEDVEDFGTGCWSTGRKRLWQLMEKPQTSMAARVVAVISVIFVVASTVAMTLNTVPELQGKVGENGTQTENQYLAGVEGACIAWFSLEYVLRLVASPSRWRFLIEAMNVIDLLAILPFFVSLILAETTNRTTSGRLDTVRRVISVFRIMRILRILKLARHSVGLQSLGRTLQRCHRELGLLVMFLAMGVLLFSSLTYFAEHEANREQFSSIPASFWWAVITMTTVGYGDMHPMTPLGKVIGAACCICGVLVVALPIPIIVNNFSEFYKDQVRRQKMDKHRKALREASVAGNVVSFHSYSTRTWIVCSLDVDKSRSDVNGIQCNRLSDDFQLYNTCDNKKPIDNNNTTDNGVENREADNSSDNTDNTATDCDSIYDNVLSEETTNKNLAFEYSYGDDNYRERDAWKDCSCVSRSDPGEFENAEIRYIDDVSNLGSPDDRSRDRTAGIKNRLSEGGRGEEKSTEDSVTKCRDLNNDEDRKKEKRQS